MITLLQLAGIEKDFELGPTPLINVSSLKKQIEPIILLEYISTFYNSLTGILLHTLLPSYN